MVGPVPAREEETAQLTGARGDFVGSLGRRVEALRVSLRSVEQNPTDAAQRNALLRRVHALSSAARVLGFASVAEALTEAERRLRHSEFVDVARSLDLLPSLLLGVPAALRSSPQPRAARAAAPWPLSVLIFGAQSLADALQVIPDTHVECERTEEVTRARELARLFGPDLLLVDADREGARELVEGFKGDPRVEPVPLLVVGDFAHPEAAAAYIALGAARVLAKPIAPEALRRTVVELRALTAEPRTASEPLGDLSVEGLVARISAEVRRGLLEAAEPTSRELSVGFGDGADVMAAVWGAVARVRELVTLRSEGAVRFAASGPEGAVPVATWAPQERRAGERSGQNEARSGDSVALQGRRIVVADDDPAVVWFMGGLLRGLGVEVLEAHDGARALALTYEAWPDLVVSDVLMPKLDGFSLCHEIKRDVAVRDVPVILLSWKEDLLQRVRELGGSADGYLRKEAAAATVAERLREVLRPRARVEQRMAAGGDARGRLDGLTPRLILELAAAGERDARVGVRDAVYLYEVQIRKGRLRSATRSASDGSFERGAFVLAALLGVSAGRFVVEADASPCRSDFEGTAAELLQAPIERARAALSGIAAASLIGVSRVGIEAPIIERYLPCTPEPARSLLLKLMAGESPRELITSGAVAPQLLEAVLSDVARRGAVTEIERASSENSELSSLAPPAEVAARRSLPSSAAAATESADDAGWFSTQAESPASLAPVSGESPVSALPFNAELTPSADKLWDKIAAGVFKGSDTLPGLGLPVVELAPSPAEPVAPPREQVAAPLQPAANARGTQPSGDELDALASALTEPSLTPPGTPVRQAPATQGQTEVMPAVSRPSSPSEPASAESAESTEPVAASVPVPSRVSALKTPLTVAPAPLPRSSGWFWTLLLAFGVSYALVSYYRMQVTPAPVSHPASAPSPS